MDYPAAIIKTEENDSYNPRSWHENTYPKRELERIPRFPQQRNHFIPGGEMRGINRPIPLIVRPPNSQKIITIHPDTVGHPSVISSGSLRPSYISRVDRRHYLFNELPTKRIKIDPTVIPLSTNMDQSSLEDNSRNSKNEPCTRQRLRQRHLTWIKEADEMTTVDSSFKGRFDKTSTKRPKMLESKSSLAPASFLYHNVGS